LKTEANDFIRNRFSSFLCAAEQLSPKGFKTVLDIDTQGTFNMCHAAFSEVDYS
jgi:peroxisomal 2,4-dienoyl-CoA reductase